VFTDRDPRYHLIRRLDRRARIALGVLGPAIRGYRLATRQGGRDRVETSVLVNVAGSLGPVVGYLLCRPGSDS
jgi:hypothetical protein